MSHYHLEIVMPPTADIEASVRAILADFDENKEDSHYSFWDFWVIGGRWAGKKRMARYDKTRIADFYAWCNAEKITVSNLQFGKQELSPPSQIPKVDAKWQEMFPSEPPIPCPLFRHSNDQFGKGTSGTLPEDVARLGETVRSLEMSRVIIAAPSDDGVEPVFMLVKKEWNGLNFMPVSWDGTLGGALDLCREHFKNYREGYAARVTPKDDWLVVTVDYHS